MKLEVGVLCVMAVVCLSACPNEESVPADAGGGVIADATVAEDAGFPDAALAPPPQVCPRGSGVAILGDINGDGTLDVADPIALENNVFRAGRAPACRPAADWNNDGRVEADDALRTTTYLVTGAQKMRTLAPGACDAVAYWPEGQCAPLALDIQAPLRVSEDHFAAVLLIRSPVLAVQGWSMSLRADGCQIARASTEQTIAAEVWDHPPGQRHLGYEATRVIEGEGAISYVILSTHEDIALPVGAGGSAVLMLEISTPAPSPGSCLECRLSAGDGLTWLGRPIDAVIVAGGYAYRPELPSVTVEVCAP